MTAHDTVTESDVTAFAHKLATWADGLTEKERIILTSTIARAAAAEGGDVEGYWVRGDFMFSAGLLHALSNANSQQNSDDRDRRPDP